MRSLESRVAEAGIRFYRWIPPRTKRCPHTPGCSELALAATQEGQGFAEVLRIVGTCKGDREATPSLTLAPLLFMLALLPIMECGGLRLSVARSSCPPMTQGTMCDDMECVSIGRQWGSKGNMPCLGIQWGSKPGGDPCLQDAPCEWVGPKGKITDCQEIGINSLNPPCGGTTIGIMSLLFRAMSIEQWGGRARRLDHGTGC